MPGFNQPVQDVQWPSGLKALEFKKPAVRVGREREPPHYMQWTGFCGEFDQPLGTFLPMSLETFPLSNVFKQPLQGVTWPSGLAVLGLGTAVSTDSIAGVEWPPRLRTWWWRSRGWTYNMPPQAVKFLVVNELGVSHSCQDESDTDSSDID